VINVQLGIRALIVCLLCLGFIPLTSALPVPIPSFSELLAAGKVQVKTWLQPQDNIVVSQQVNLQIEVAIQNWFSAGTKIGPLEIKDAVVLRRERFAVNSSRHVMNDGKRESWAVQLWSLTIYPQRSGRFNVPPIALTLTVAGENNQPISGTVNTQALTFEAAVPSAMKNTSHWLAASQFEVQERYDKDSSALIPGDSLQRTIHIKAQDVAAMMLPALTFEPMLGLAVYQKPSIINDHVNRGDYLAERTESISYVLEQPGEYRLPALTFHWWDLNTQQRQTIVLPARLVSTLAVPSPIPAPTKMQTSVENRGYIMGLTILATVMILLLVMGGWRRVARREKKPIQPHSVNTLHSLQQQFIYACHHQHFGQAVSLLYLWLDHRAHGDTIQPVYLNGVRIWLDDLGEAQLYEQFNQLMQYACGERHNSSRAKTNEFEFLLQGLKKISESPAPMNSWLPPIDLRLN
jgi:hypothetical protein